MRRQIGWLMAATTSAVVLAFVIPLCLLVRTLAEDRAVANADQEARNVAILISGLSADPRLDQLVAAVDARSRASVTSVLTADGEVVGRPDPDMAEDPVVRRAAAGNSFTEIDDSGAQVLIPVVTADGTSVVRTWVSDETMHQGVVRAWVSICALGAALLVAAVLVAARLGRRISTPVTDLATVANELRAGDLDARAEPSGPTETVELGVALNRLAERITELLASERAAVGDLSHRLRTPVTALRLDVDSVRDPELNTRLQDHVVHLQRTVDAIVNDARRPVRSTMTSSCDATKVVRERVDFWSALAEDQDRMLTVEIPSAPCPVPLDPADLRDIVDILVDNVFAHTPEGVSFAIELSPEDPATLSVRDWGPGLLAYDAGSEDGDSTRTDGADGDRAGSTGLGLQIVRRAVSPRGGDVSVRAMPDRGLRVDVTLAAASAPG